MTDAQVQTNPDQITLTTEVLPAAGLPEAPEVSDAELRRRAHELVHQWQPSSAHAQRAAYFQARLDRLAKRLSARLSACEAIARLDELTPQLELLESTRMLRNVLLEAESAKKQIARLPLVSAAEGDVLPRIMRVGEVYLDAAQGIWSAQTLSTFITALQDEEPLYLREMHTLPTFLKLAQLEFILDRADETFAGVIPSIEQSPFSGPLHSLRRLNQFEWSELLEELVPFHSILAQDPYNVFLCMDEETRAGYMERVAELATRSDENEVEVARAAVELARAADQHGDAQSHVARRRAHVGYFLFEEGLPDLVQKIGYHSPLHERLRRWLMRNAEDVYILSIFVLSVLAVAGLTLPLVPHHELAWTLAALFLALLPATQGASDLVNNAVTSLLRPRALPKLDYTNGLPATATTFVVVPTLLLNESQVVGLFEELYFFFFYF